MNSSVFTRKMRAGNQGWQPRENYSAGHAMSRTELPDHAIRSPRAARVPAERTDGGLDMRNRYPEPWFPAECLADAAPGTMVQIYQTSFRLPPRKRISEWYWPVPTSTARGIHGIPNWRGGADEANGYVAGKYVEIGRSLLA